jgi:hypothetical protein
MRQKYIKLISWDKKKKKYSEMVIYMAMLLVAGVIIICA